ncbi:uncharacterized protein LOC131281169 [Anopheles ziemanni]|uniref:uncharacterized protein LOC131267176 n=1 Tax=Anopheles coustani TaxID=139045 RepID=UPI0026599F2A|nr:uncharacterized protein LOC131267176 [Anopheles coustani]XP_058125953.1 uncharacterized protein LOC131267176 [Anopheles coustani]XP_058166412.1 uncharacterized protein LOC131281169 [Anopheles ziemanni]
MMSLVEVWNTNEESPTKIPTKEQHHRQHQEQQEQQEHQHYQTHCMQLDTMQDIICEEETVRYVHVKSEDGSGGNNNNNCINSNNNNNGINSSSSNSSNNNLQGMDKDEKRMRREIANSNERRRMQSINAGFQSLRQMLPHHEGEKLSKAAILQQTAEYIYSLEQEKTRLLSQNCQLKRLLDQQDHNGDSASQVSAPTVTGSTIVATGNGGSVVSQQTGTVVTTVAKKRKIDTIVTVQPVSDSSDEGLGSMSPEPVTLRGVSVTTASNGSNVSGATTGGVSTNSSSSNNGRQCTTVNFSVKDYLELKHQLDVERRQKSIVEDRLKALERQLYPTRVQYQDSPDLHVPSGDCSTGEPQEQQQQQQQQQQQSAPEEVAVSIIHKPIVAGSVVGGKLSRSGQELDSGMSVISLDSNSLGKGQQIVVCSSELIEEALSMQTASGGAPAKQLLIPLKDEKKMFIKRSRSRSPTVGNRGEPTVVTLPPKKNRFPSILEAAIKAEPKVEVERISSPSSIVVTDDQMIVTSAGSHMTPVQQPPMNIYHRHNLETIVEAIRHLEGDVFDKVLPAQQQQQQSSLHQSQPQPTQPASQSTIQQRPVQDVPLALTTSKQQQQQPKTDRDHRQSQLEPYLKFRTTPGSTTGTATTVAIVATADPNNIVTVAAPPPASSIITVSIPSTGSSSHPTATSGVCHSPAASSTTTSTIVANGTAAAAASSIPQHTQQTTAAQILQQQQCRPGVIVVKQHS